MARQRNRFGRNPICKCGKKKERPRQGYCNYCRNKWSRENRASHKDYSEPEKLKGLARQKLRLAIISKRLKKGICFCGETKVEAHHEDYSKPLDVVWYCRKHHLEYHNPDPASYNKNEPESLND